MNAIPKIEVCLSPSLLHLYDISNSIVVVIDIFRASSTIVAAMHNGAEKVIPIDSVESCIAQGALTRNSVTAGERDGKIAPGLSFGNSPSEYPRAFIEGKTLLLTTTNGTKLLHMAAEASQIIIGSFLNLSAICDYIISQNKDVLLACAAWKDKVNMEDALFAGAVVDRVKDSFEVYCDSGRITSGMYRNAIDFPSLIDYLKESTHYKRLSSYGLEADMEYCTQVDIHPVVPLYDGAALLPAIF